MAAVVDAQSCGELPGLHPAMVIASDYDVPGILKAQDRGIPTFVMKRSEYPTISAYGKALAAKAKQFSDLVLQLGWLNFTPEEVIKAFEGWIFNQHPVPLDPENKDADGKPLHFGGKGMHGLAAHAAVLKFQRLAHRSFDTEATIHRVTTEVDGGAVVYRRAVEVRPQDTPERLAARVLPHEHIAQVLFLRKLLDGEVEELTRTTPLIQPDEKPLLQEAIVFARNEYPNG